MASPRDDSTHSDYSRPAAPTPDVRIQPGGAARLPTILLIKPELTMPIHITNSIYKGYEIHITRSINGGNYNADIYKDDKIVGAHAGLKTSSGAQAKAETHIDILIHRGKDDDKYARIVYDK